MVRTRASARLANISSSSGPDTSSAGLPLSKPEKVHKNKKDSSNKNQSSSAIVPPFVAPVAPVVSVAPTPAVSFLGVLQHPMNPYDSRQVLPVPPRASATNPYHITQGMQYLYDACKAGNFPVHPDVRFRQLPFHQMVAEILKPSSLQPTLGVRNQEGTFYFHLTPQQAADIMSGPDPNTIQVQLRFCLLETSCEQDDCFPPSCSVKINNKICQLPMPIPTNKTGVEPKRPPGPVNITSLLKVSPTVANTVTVNWTSDFVCRYALCVSLARKLTSAHLLNRLRNRGTKHSDYTRSLIKEKLREDLDCEIATTSLRVSLICPLGKMRMCTPCRPTSCFHLQCFDASLFLQMNERKPTWVCPVCDKSAPYEVLVVDGYFQDVLNSPLLSKDCNEIQLHKDGTWSAHIKKEEVQEDFINDTCTNIEYIQDDMDELVDSLLRPGAASAAITSMRHFADVIPLSDGSESSNGLPALKRAAGATAAHPDTPAPWPSAVVDLTSDSEDDLPLKRRVPQPSQPAPASTATLHAADQPSPQQIIDDASTDVLSDDMYGSNSQHTIEIAVSSIITVPDSPSPAPSPTSVAASPPPSPPLSPRISPAPRDSTPSPVSMSNYCPPTSPIPSPRLQSPDLSPSPRFPVNDSSVLPIQPPFGDTHHEVSALPQAIIAPFQPEPDPLPDHLNEM